MIHEKIILRIIALLIENNKKYYLRYMRVIEMYEMKHELHDWGESVKIVKVESFWKYLIFNLKGFFQCYIVYKFPASALSKSEAEKK